MYSIKSIFVLLVLIIFVGIFSVSAQTLSLTQTNVSKEIKSLVINHLKTSKAKGSTANQAMKDLSSGNLVGFNIGMPPAQNIIIIIFKSSEVIHKTDRLSSDGLRISAELGAGLRKQGISPEKSMAFQVNTRTMKVESFTGKGTTRNIRQ